MRRQVEQRNLLACGFGHCPRRQQLADRLIQPHLSLRHHPRQHQPGERLRNRANFKQRVRLRGSIGEHSPLAALPDSDRQSSSCPRRQFPGGQLLPQIAIHHRLQFARRHRNRRCIESQRRKRGRCGVRGEQQRQHQAHRAVQQNDGQAQRRRHRRHLRQKHRARPHRQGRQHQHIAPVRKRRIPAQYREQTHYQHRGRDQEVLRDHGDTAAHCHSGPSRAQRGLRKASPRTILRR